MVPFHTLCPEIAQHEVKCLLLEPSPASPPPTRTELPPDEYAYMDRKELAKRAGPPPA